MRTEELLFGSPTNNMFIFRITLIGLFTKLFSMLEIFEIGSGAEGEVRRCELAIPLLRVRTE